MYPDASYHWSPIKMHIESVSMGEMLKHLLCRRSQLEAKTELWQIQNASLLQLEKHSSIVTTDPESENTFISAAALV